ncbi:hypothetical protein MJM04_34725, partial [Salmonella enterica subsp. enterica serovar Cerro]|nr:hypothetical protein [Salmonella enterica subsp. enterica serovar Cerro]
QGMEKWLADPQLLEADADAEYAAVIDIDLADIKEPILCAPNDSQVRLGKCCHTDRAGAGKSGKVRRGNTYFREVTRSRSRVWPG